MIEPRSGCADIPAEELVRCGHRSNVEDRELFWLAAGEGGDHVPLLFLHGIPTWSWLWRNVIPVTGKLTRSIAVDLPGFGMSEQIRDHDYRVATLASTIEGFLDDVVGPDRPVSLVVHDFGALVGAELIARAPARYPKLVVTNTSLRSGAWVGGGPLRILSVPWLGQLSMWLAQPWMLRLAMAPFVVDPDARSGLRFDGYWFPFRHGFGQTLARFYQQRPVQPDDFIRWREALSNYPGDALVLWGARDPAFTLYEMNDIESLLPRSEAMIFDHAGHFLPEELPGSVGRRIRAFLAGVPV